jgi:integrase
VSLARFRDELLELYRPPARSPRTFAKMRQILGLLEDPLGLTSIGDLTPTTITRFAALPGLEPTTMQGYLGYLRAACSYAAFMGYLLRDPFRFRRCWVRSSRVRAAEAVHHALAEIARVLDWLKARSGTWEGQRLYALAHVYAFAALRRDEALHLKVADVDLAARIVRVGEHLPTKTAGSIAPVPMAPPLVEVLAAWMPRCGSEWLFPNRADKPWAGGTYGTRPTEKLREAGDACGVSGFTPLSLRHSFATHAEGWGLSELMVQRILRHTTPRTQRHYRHADLVNMAGAVECVRFG